MPAGARRPSGLARSPPARPQPTGGPRRKPTPGPRLVHASDSPALGASDDPRRTAARPRCRPCRVDAGDVAVDVCHAPPGRARSKDAAGPERPARRADEHPARARALEGRQLQPPDGTTDDLLRHRAGAGRARRQLPLSLAMAWTYVALRVVHSLVQALVNKIEVRFALFVLSTLPLFVLTWQAGRMVWG